MKKGGSSLHRQQQCRSSTGTMGTKVAPRTAQSFEDAHQKVLYHYLAHLESTCGKDIVRSWLENFQRNRPSIHPREIAAAVNGVPVRYECAVCEAASGSRSKSTSRANSPSATAAAEPRPTEPPPLKPTPHLLGNRNTTNRSRVGVSSSSAVMSSTSLVQPSEAMSSVSMRRTPSGVSAGSSTATWDQLFISQVNTATRNLSSLSVHVRLRHESLAGLANIMSQMLPNLAGKALGSDDPLAFTASKLLCMLAFQLRSLELSLAKIILPMMENLVAPLGSLLTEEALANFFPKVLFVMHHPNYVTIESEFKQVVEAVSTHCRAVNVVKHLTEHLVALLEHSDEKGKSTTGSKEKASTRIAPAGNAAPTMVFVNAEEASKMYDYFRAKVLQLLAHIVDRESVKVRYLYDDMMSPGEYVLPWYETSGKTMKGLRDLRDAIASRHQCRRDEIVLVSREGDDIALSSAVAGLEAVKGAAEGEETGGLDDQRTISVHDCVNPHPFVPVFADPKGGSRARTPVTSQLVPNVTESGGSTAATLDPLGTTVTATITDLSTIAGSPPRIHDESASRLSVARQLWRTLLAPGGDEGIEGQHGHFAFEILYVLFPTETIRCLQDLCGGELIARLSQKLLLDVTDPQPQAQNFLISHFPQVGLRGEVDPNRSNDTMDILVEGSEAQWSAAKPAFRRPARPTTVGFEGHSSSVYVSGASVQHSREESRRRAGSSSVSYSAASASHVSRGAGSSAPGIRVITPTAAHRARPTPSAVTTFHRSHTTNTCLSIPTGAADRSVSPLYRDPGGVSERATSVASRSISRQASPRAPSASYR